MRKGFLLVCLLLVSQYAFCQNEIGPEGYKLFWVFLVVAAITAVLAFSIKPSGKTREKKRKPLFKHLKVQIELSKDALYYPDSLRLSVKNTGNSDIDLDQPLLEFDNFWLKRKFKIKGMENRTFYPLFLEKGKSHTLQIDLTRFYGHDKSLKKYPKAKIYLRDVSGKKLGSKAVYLRKTLIKF